jgi:hypothetical protein
MNFVRGSKFLLMAWTPVSRVTNDGLVEELVADVLLSVDGVFDINAQDRYAFSFKISHCFDRAVVLDRIREALQASGYETVSPPKEALLSLKEQKGLEDERI